MATTKAQIQSIIDTLTVTLTDAEKFDGGNASAGTRVRKTLHGLKATIQETRVNVQTVKNERLAAKTTTTTATTAT